MPFFILGSGQLATPWGELLAFIGLLAVGQFSPGPDMLLLTQTSLRHGRKAGWWTTLGIATGLSVHATFALTGLQWIVRHQTSLWPILQSIAAAYLLWLAINLWREAKEPPPAPGTQITHPSRSHFLRGLLCNLLNPKVLLFFAAVVTPFLASEHPTWWPTALGLVIVLEGLVLWGLWVVFLQHPGVRSTYHKAASLINRIFALLMFILALRLLWEAAQN